AVDIPTLIAYYQTASVFVSLSEHEGFGVPLLEAMRFRLPVVAYDAAAVGETVGKAAVLLAERDLAEAAESCALVTERTQLREQPAPRWSAARASLDGERRRLGRDAPAGPQGGRLPQHHSGEVLRGPERARAPVRRARPRAAGRAREGRRVRVRRQRVQPPRARGRGLREHVGRADRYRLGTVRRRARSRGRARAWR